MQEQEDSSDDESADSDKAIDEAAEGSTVGPDVVTVLLENIPVASKTEPMQISEREEVTTAAGSNAEPCVANVLQGNLESAEYSPEYSDADSEQYSDAESSGSDDPQEDAEVAQRVEETRGQISRPSKVRRLIGSKLTEVRHRWSPLFGFAA